MYKLKTLANGLKFIAVPLAGARTATALVMVRTGSKYENRRNNGISHFLEHMFFKGTAKRPSAQAISSELDRLGADYNAFTAKEFTGYYVKASAAKLPQALSVLSDIFLNSVFDAGEIEREKGVIVEELNMYEDNPMMHIEDVFEECLYGDQPAGWETIGTKENILNFRQKDFLDYYHSHYGAADTVVCLAGNFKKKDETEVKKVFSAMKKLAANKKAKTKEAQTAPAVLVKHKKTDQAHISLGFRTVPLGHRDEFALKLLAILLGGSMSSRMFLEVREKRGLAYYVRTETEFYSDAGYLTTAAGVPLEKIDEAIAAILGEYARIMKEPAAAVELKKVKDMVAGKFDLQLESSDANASWFARKALERREVMTPAGYLAIIKKITAEDLNKAAKKYFSGRGLNLAVIGPYQDSKKFEKLLKIDN